MPRKKFDKASSTTFQVVHRPQNDPKIHDEASNSAVFKELAPTQSHKIKTRRDLESELFHDRDPSTGGLSIRHNEGEAAEHGIYFDDTEYDYMQHIRDLDAGAEDGERFFVEARNHNDAKKGQNKMSLEQALRVASLGDDQSESSVSKAESLFGEGMVVSKSLTHGSYQYQQDIPDVLAGFQPDMDPRLREVLEALDDDAYVDDEEDFFSKITTTGGESTHVEFDDSALPDGEEDDGWESDVTERPTRDGSLPTLPHSPISMDEVMSDAQPLLHTDHGDGDWMKEFSRFKHDQKSTTKQPRPATGGDVQSSVLTGGTSLTGGRRKKRKGAMTNSTGYSMTSSSLARTEGLSLLDARFDKIDEMYAEDDGMDIDIDDSASMFSKNSLTSGTSNVSRASGSSNLSTTSSQAPELASQGFGDMMDEFLGGYSTVGKNRVLKGGKQSGMAQLDEMRRELGPARVKVSKAR